MLSSLVNATELAKWADRRDAQENLPRLIRQLVYATVHRLDRIDFRAGEGIQLDGWDGIVQLEKGNAFVPDGTSAWEISNDSRSSSIADENYRKRTRDPLGVEIAESTFIFVTARRWAGKRAWADCRREEGTWRDVRAYDADDLELWLEQAPAVSLAFGEQLGVVGPGVESVERHWQTWGGQSSPPITPNALLMGRSTSQKHIVALNGQSGIHSVRADSAEEASAFVCGAILSDPQLTATAVVVVADDGWRFVRKERGD